MIMFTPTCLCVKVRVHGRFISACICAHVVYMCAFMCACVHLFLRVCLHVFICILPSSAESGIWKGGEGQVEDTGRWLETTKAEKM